MNYGKLATCLASVSALGLLAACDGTGDQVKQEDASHSSMVMQSDADLGMTLPEGYVATIYADNLGFARHITTRDDGAVYVALRRAHEDKGIVALRDNDGDGHADDVQYFGDVIGTGIEVRGDYLYFGTDTAVVRFKFNGDELIPSGAMETVVSGFPEQRQHAVKPFTFDDDGNIYVNVGADANACQQEMRTAGSPGMMPCPILDVGAGIWKFNADATDQVFDGSARYATGIRNAVALDWNHSQNALYFAQHGRDQLSAFWPDYYTDEDSAELPAEEFHRAAQGSNHGWPYTYWDHKQGARMQGPEYGGDGKMLAEGDFATPVGVTGGHWAPNDLIFVEGDGLGSHMKGAALIAFHGSWNRAPLPQEGYKIVAFPMNDDGSAGEMSVFSDGYKGVDVLANPRQARFRPMGLAQARDGALFIADSMKGRVWRVQYVGK